MPLYSFGCSSCGYEDVQMLPMSKYDSKPKCPECPKRMHRQVDLPAVVTEDNFGIGGRFNIHTDDFQTRSEYNRWKKAKIKKANDEGRECHIGEKMEGKRKDRGQRIADDIAKHGPAARKHYKSESQRETLAKKD